mmetsp:Transcript_119192/g.337916  ORF Transcript_119192/g.337916 Transcript_119192/m.337916 type:complete len:206 (+) Transcript_119192:399-1016(+)
MRGPGWATARAPGGGRTPRAMRGTGALRPGPGCCTAPTGSCSGRRGSATPPGWRGSTRSASTFSPWPCAPWRPSRSCMTRSAHRRRPCGPSAPPRRAPSAAAGPPRRHGTAALTPSSCSTCCGSVDPGTPTGTWPSVLSRTWPSTRSSSSPATKTRRARHGRSCWVAMQLRCFKSGCGTFAPTLFRLVSCATRQPSVWSAGLVMP